MPPCKAMVHRSPTAGQPYEASKRGRTDRTNSDRDVRVQRGEGGGGGLQPPGQLASMSDRLNHAPPSLLLEAHGSGGGAAQSSQSQAVHAGPHMPLPPHAERRTSDDATQREMEIKRRKEEECGDWLLGKTAKRGKRRPEEAVRWLRTTVAQEASRFAAEEPAR